MLAAFSAHRPVLIGIFPINSGTHEGSVAPEAPRQLGEASEIKRLYTKSFVQLRVMSQDMGDSFVSGHG